MWKVTGQEDLTTNLTTTALSGDKICDIAIPIFWNTASLLTNRVVADLRAIPTIDLTADYWEADANRLLSVKGVQRAAACGLTCTPATETAAVVFNKRIISEMNLDNPYTLYNNNQWTVPKLREMAKAATKDLDGVAGMTKNDQFGITTLDKNALQSNVLAAQGMQIITKEADGVFNYNMTDPNLVGMLKTIQDWFCNDGSIYDNSDQTAQHAQFRDGKALFYIFQLSYLPEFANMKDDYGVVPFPKGEGMSNYIGEMNWNTNLMVIPTTVKGDDLNNIGAVVQALAYYSRNDNQVKMNETVGRYLRDSESAGMLKAISDSAIHSPHLLVASPRFPEIEQTTTHILGGTSDITYDFAQNINQTKNSGRSEINKFNASMARK